MNKAAVFHISSDQYCYAINSDEIIITLQTGKDIDKVEIVHGDPYSGGIMGGDWKWNGSASSMHVVRELKEHLLWEIKLKLAHKRNRYYFKVYENDVYFNFLEEGFLTEEELENHAFPRMFVFSWLNDIDIIHTPDWVKSTVWYQIFPERFYKGHEDKENVVAWDSKEVISNYEFYGGDILGINKKLEYLKDLGISGLYLTPIFESHTSHKYDTINYTKIDEDFGTKQETIDMIKKAHDLEIKIMFDAVFNHCGVDFMQWQDVVKNKEKSIYKDWFIINDFDKLENQADTKDNQYYAFGFHADMPKINTNNVEVQQFLLDVVKYYITEFDIDGIRLDVANEISHDFWRKMRTMVDEIKPDFYIIGEVWYNSINWLRGDQFSSVMNYPFTAAITNFYKNKNQTSQEFIHNINTCYSMYPRQVNNVLFNLLDSHDTQRLISSCNDKNIAFQQLIFMFTNQGTPCIFYGTEILLEGKHDPHCRRCMPWEKMENGEFLDVNTMVKNIIKLRNDYPELNSENLKWVKHDTRVIEYIKEIGPKKIRVVINASSEDIDVEVKMDNVLLSNLFSDKLNSNGFIVEVIDEN